jgi:DNA polymerase-3 subunit gamma/tau
MAADVPDHRTAADERAALAASSESGYVVVARRYRPQSFDELIGQEHVGKALKGAIESARVGHAYLFTGARGVGKTSAARILAKALNCQSGPTTTPCNTCDVCERVANGDDVDVLEIDGASNRGIDEIRQLRANVSVRPSRSLFKVYIIDEVHMLTREAFNALLKTLEEPPEHVKFIFCTTEPNKIPITILSRCQRFDFAGIQTSSIAERLRQIVAAEGVTADDESLDLIARRAAGSMRDSQSLLEQLLAFGSQKITADEVHAMLGTAGDVVLGRLVTHLTQRDAGAALVDLDDAITAGCDVSQLVEQLLGYYRDCMAVAVGCSQQSLLYVSPGNLAEIEQVIEATGLQTILATLQIIEQTLSRMRQSMHGRTLAELALVQIGNLADLDELPALIASLREGGPLPVRPRTPNRPAQPRSEAPVNETPSSDTRGTPPAATPPAATPPAATPPAATPTASQPANEPEAVATATAATETLTGDSAGQIWRMALEQVSPMVAEHAAKAASVANPAPNRLAVTFKAQYTFNKEMCERSETLKTLEQAVADLTGQTIRISFDVLPDVGGNDQGDSAEGPKRRVPTQRQLMADVAQQPMVKKAAELFDAQTTRVVPSEKDPNDKDT